MPDAIPTNQIVPASAPSTSAPPPDDANGDDDGVSGRWREMAQAAAGEVRERLAHVQFPRLSPGDRERIARRLREAVEMALRVPEGRPDELAAEIRTLREASPGVSATDLAWRRTRERARRAAAAGAATTVPALVPGVGTALAALGMVADWHFVAEQQRDLVLEIAALYGVELADPTSEVRGLFLASTGLALGAARAGDAAAKAASAQVARRWMSRLVPGLGAAVAGGLNYVSTLAVGRTAIARFSHEAGVEVRGLSPAAMNPALPRLRQATVTAIQAAALGDGTVPVYTREQREILEHLSQAEREELLDLAVLGAADEGVSADEETVLAHIAGELGFGPAELDEALRGARDGVQSVRGRFTRLVGRAGRGGAETARHLWSRARRLSSRGEHAPGD
jgi:hypothetical protein